MAFTSQFSALTIFFPFLGSSKKINPQNCAGCWFVYKAYPPVHIKICAGGCNAVDEPADKQGVDLFISGALILLLVPVCRGEWYYCRAGRTRLQK